MAVCLPQNSLRLGQALIRREEQHDDQMLHELIRCVKALSTSEIGKSALRSSFPRPFDAFSGLLFSEKKPGDLPVRQLIIELWTFVFELFPPARSAQLQHGTGMPAGSRSAGNSPTMTMAPVAPYARDNQAGGAGSRPSSVRFDTSQADQLAAMLAVKQGPLGSNSGAVASQAIKVDAVEAVRAFLVPQQDDKKAEQHAFILQAHRPKVFKAWVQELSDICRDYFWYVLLLLPPAVPAPFARRPFDCRRSHESSSIVLSSNSGMRDKTPSG